jgi:hypothetical protein
VCVFWGGGEAVLYCISGSGVAMYSSTEYTSAQTECVCADVYSVLL